MARRMISKVIALAVAAALCGCTGTGPGAPPLERMALFPVQLMALPFMILRPFAPLIQAGMEAGIQMAPYMLMFGQNDAGPSGFAVVGLPVIEGADLPPSLPSIEALLAEEGGVERIVAVDLEEIGGGDNLRSFLTAMGKSGMRYRCVAVDAGDMLFDTASLDRLKNILLENGVSFYTTGRLSAAVSARFGDEYIRFSPDDNVSRSWCASVTLDTGS